MGSKLISSPSFCIIAPTAYLRHYATQSNIHLVLAHLVDTDEAYASFYKELSEQDGQVIIMDNSAFEKSESYEPSKLVQLGARCGADVLVLPDYPFQPAQKTIDAATQWIPYFKDAGFGTFFVPQSERGQLEDWVQAYEWGANNPDIDVLGVSILGVPNALPHIPAAYARVVMMQLLQDRGIFTPTKHHHMLGLNSGPALEIPPLLEMSALDSCDSSNPVWMAILGHEYTRNADSYLMVSKVKKEVEFDFPFIKDLPTHRRIQTNLDLTLELFK